MTAVALMSCHVNRFDASHEGHIVNAINPSFFWASECVSSLVAPRCGAFNSHEVRRRGLECFGGGLLDRPCAAQRQGKRHISPRCNLGMPARPWHGSVGRQITMAWGSIPETWERKVIKNRKNLITNSYHNYHNYRIRSIHVN